MNTVKKLKKIYDELDSVFVKECHSTDYSINGCRVCPYYSHNECDFEKTEININHLIYVSEKLETQRKKRVAKKYKKTIYVTEEDCRTLLHHSPTAYLHPGSVKSICATFDNGYEVVIGFTPTFELEDDFTFSLFGKNDEFIKTEYYEHFQETWMVTDPNTCDEYELTLIRSDKPWLSGEAYTCRQEKVSNNKVLEKHEQENKPSKIIHELTITVDEETLKDWDNPTGFMDGGYKAVWGEFDNYLTVKVKPSMTLEGDDFIEVCLYKDGKEVSSTYPDFLFDPIRLEYNNEEYHIQLEKECKEKRPELRYTEDYF